MTVYLINDKIAQNTQYRSGLIELLQNKKQHRFISLGIFDSNLSLFKFLIKVLFSKPTLIISSNLRANLIALLLVSINRVIILNGLGRYRNIKWLRYYILSCMRLSKRNTKLLVQNYADFRYFRRFSRKGFFVEWVPGSGGQTRLVGRDHCSVSIITRDKKIALQLKSINDFLSKVCKDEKIWIIGTDDPSIGSSLVASNITFTGKVPQQNILVYSSKLFVPDGYGEGIPHTLVDAIVSGVSIYVSKRNFIRFGLYLFLEPEEYISISNYIYISEVSKLRTTYEMSSVIGHVERVIDDQLKINQ